MPAVVVKVTRSLSVIRTSSGLSRPAVPRVEIYRGPAAMCSSLAHAQLQAAAVPNGLQLSAGVVEKALTGRSHFQ